MVGVVHRCYCIDAHVFCAALFYVIADTQKWEYNWGAIGSGGRICGAAQNAGINEGMNINRIDYSVGENTDYIEALLKETLNEAGAAIVLLLIRWAQM